LFEKGLLLKQKIKEDYAIFLLLFAVVCVLTNDFCEVEIA